MQEKIKLLKKQLNQLADDNFNKYQGKQHDADFFLHVGKADAFGEAVELIDDIFINKLPKN